MGAPLQHRASGRADLGLRLPRRLLSELEQRAAAGYPYEVCGLLIGRNGATSSEAMRVVEARNLNRERPRDRYLLDPDDFLAADRAALLEGLEIIGFWHSHPDHPARPSATDLEAAWAGYTYLILTTTATGAGEVRSWRLRNERFVEEIVHLEDP